MADDFDTSVLAKTVDPVRAYVASLTDLAELSALHEAERAGDNRKGVLNAIEERRGELGIEHHSEGLARGSRTETVLNAQDAAHAAVATTPMDEAAQEPSPAASSQPAAPWTVKKWKGLDLYVCVECGNDSFDRGEMVKHVARKHGRTA